jgi:hypothetical protein
MAADQRGFQMDDETPEVITQSYLVSLHARVKRAAKIHDRNQAYLSLVQRGPRTDKRQSI